ncbi:hypothetical protein [Blastococcus jejuensis]|uniref:hypothetical protein n=1 Tax=Blastococcus jejuensis TaxID=351224 RepID=UPI0031E4754E
MFTAVVAWLAVLAVCVAAVLLGQTARTAPVRRRSRAARIGLFVSLSGPWLTVLAGAAIGLITGAWLAAAAGTACAIVLVALVGLALRPR